MIFLIIGIFLSFAISMALYETGKYNIDEFEIAAIYFLFAAFCFTVLTIIKFILQKKIVKRKTMGFIIFILSVCLLGMALLILIQIIYHNDPRYLDGELYEELKMFGKIKVEPIETIGIFSLIIACPLALISQILLAKPKLIKAL